MNKGMSTVVSNGVIGGIVGGIVFGILMQMMGMMGMIAGMMGSESLAVGWIIHMIISVIFGVSYGILTLFVKNLWVAAVLFGIGIWIIGPLLIMPMMMGMGTNFANAFTPDMLMSLGTHLFFSFLVAIVFKVRSTHASTHSQIQA
ncbi:hypothetical protein QTG56_02190 [Rossellomorea sp. AcN35-11]|nr:DUF1440 domain-containing protein [Rossellomorea aquimaris]NMH68178.1 DUF2938 domain-containing protein [Bacillus sp. RO3]WJV29991.1 hypothetical protein QTG56_02190 [Rossellomorea sp. AcN35-11]